MQVCVTGSSGFIGSHVVGALLTNGYHVRAAVRDPTNKDKTAHLTKLAEAEESKGQLEFVQGDLLTPGSYDAAFAGCDFVVHCAAVVNNASNTKDPVKEIVNPSVEGSRNVYDSVQRSGTVKRVVHTSSIASIQSYDKEKGRVFSEEDWNEWSSTTNGDYYGLGKTKAEKLAHDAAKASGGQFDVVCINPALVLGPCMTKAHTKASPVFVRQLLFGNAQPDVPVTLVDVRDVAEAHVQALKRPEAGGQRFILAGDTDTHMFRFPKLVEALRSLCPGVKFVFKPFAGLLYNLYWYTTMSEFEKKVQTTDCPMNNSKSKAELGIKYTPIEDTLKATVSSMLDTGFVTLKK